MTAAYAASTTQGFKHTGPATIQPTVAANQVLQSSRAVTTNQPAYDKDSPSTTAQPVQTDQQIELH